MKKYIPLITLLAITGTTFGVYIDHFKSWGDLIEKSSNIIVARCTATPGFTHPGAAPKSTLSFDGVIQSEIEAIAVLKGNTKAGLSQMGSSYKPRQGELFLVFANYTTFGTNSWYSAIEGYRIIPLNPDFQINNLSSKTLNEQIQLVFTSRLNDLKEELARNTEEKKRLEAGIKK